MAEFEDIFPESLKETIAKGIKENIVNYVGNDIHGRSTYVKADVFLSNKVLTAKLLKAESQIRQLLHGRKKEACQCCKHFRKGIINGKYQNPFRYCLYREHEVEGVCGGWEWNSELREGE